MNAQYRHHDPKNSSILNTDCEVLAFHLRGDGTFPNNPKLPLVAYLQALRLGTNHGPEQIEQILAANRWNGSWRNGIYAFQHYHSTAHEVLAVYAGSAV